jgi:DNA-binding transcriptional LysR family regulator
MFKAIVETERFTVAAERLRVAQPSVSQQINLLEHELGAKLFLRLKNRKLVITEAGHLLKDHAELILRQCELAQMEISSLTARPAGRIRIGLGGHQLTSMLPPALVAFHTRFPHVCADVVNGTTPQLVQMLKSNQLDVGVVNLPVQGREVNTIQLFREEMVLVVSRRHGLAKRRSIRPAEIEVLQLILYDQSTSTRRMLDAFFHESGITPKVILELNSVEAMKKMVEAGLGAAIIPESSLVVAPNNQLKALRIEGGSLTRAVGVVVPTQPRFPTVICVLVDLLKERFNEVQLCLKGGADCKSVLRPL